MPKDEEQNCYRMTAALLAIISPLSLGIPGRRLLHALIWAHAVLEPNRSGEILCVRLREVFWPSARDLSELRNGIVSLYGTGLFDLLEICGRRLHFCWSFDAFARLTAPVEAGYGSFEIKEILTKKSEYHLRLHELVSLNAEKAFPTFAIPAIDPKGIAGVPWERVRCQWLTSAAVHSFLHEEAFLFGLVKHTATGTVLRVSVKIETEKSKWIPGNLYSFAHGKFEHVELIRVVGGSHTNLPDYLRLGLRMATHIDPKRSKKSLPLDG